MTPLLPSLSRGLVAVCFVLVCAMMADCATLPDTDQLGGRYSLQTARINDTLGPVSAKRSAAIIDSLKKKSGDIDILDRQIALEQDIDDNPLVLGNRVTLLEDGPQTYQAMFKVIAAAKDHVNLESFIISDDDTGKQFADLLISRQRQGVQINVIYDAAGGNRNAPCLFRSSDAGGHRRSAI
ncbi:hypothetical protein [Pandoraea sp. PE-S2T-3]|uniref:hypothetical protein n=1 Tax=Pandoraea sp. PE-S2T-3 TaxID=1986993 RepID=UPI0020CE025A|nr:hypothetical protein [Pandoraea sp. PE-S2T-3]